MLKYLAGVASALLLVAAGVFLFRSSATAEAPVLVASTAARPVAPQDALPADEPLPEAAALTREQRRFNRYDKDRDAAIAREEYLQFRRKAYAKLDTNGDGRLSFDEWAAKTVAKFTAADRDRSGSLNAAEFATTAVKRSPARARRCPPQQAPNEAD